MGAWGPDPFGNDTACDWKYDVEKADGFELIEETMDNVLAVEDDYLEAPDAAVGIAAADTVARLRGHFYVKNSYTKSLDAWVGKQTGEVPPALVQLAVRVVDRVMTEPSELLELWSESGDPAEWTSQLEDLKERLTAPAKPN